MGRLTTKGYGKGFEYFMSHKDFHPSAWWNLKKVHLAREKKRLADEREKEMRAEYIKEQEWVNNRALLGDKKATLGITFMYDPPPGLNRKPPPPKEPKYEWQRNFNPPREETARGRDDVYDKPFAIPVKQVRCIKCKTWGMHHRTDRECPYFNLTGNKDDPGASTRPSDIVKHHRSQQSSSDGDKQRAGSSSSKAEAEEPPAVAPPNDDMGKPLLEKGDTRHWNATMRDEFGFQLKPGHLAMIEAHERVKQPSTSQELDDIGSTDGVMSNEEKKRILRFLCELPSEDRSRIIRAVFCDSADTEIVEKRSSGSPPRKKKKKKTTKRARKTNSGSVSPAPDAKPAAGGSEKRVQFELPDHPAAIKNEADSDEELSSSLLHERVIRDRILTRTQQQLMTGVGDSALVASCCKSEPETPDMRRWPSDAQAADRSSSESSESDAEDWRARKRKAELMMDGVDQDDDYKASRCDSDDSDYEWAAASMGRSRASQPEPVVAAATSTATTDDQTLAGASSTDDDSDDDVDNDKHWNSHQMQTVVNSTINELFAGL